MSDKIEYPDVDYRGEQETIESIHGYARLLGAIRGSMTPKQKDYWHISLRTGPLGLRTTPIPSPDGHTFELLLDLVSHSALVTTSQGYTWTLPIEGQPLKAFTESVLNELWKLGIKPEIDMEKFQDGTERTYNFQAASDLFRFYSIFDMALKEFKGTLSQETSPVQLWPHHMDIAFACFAESGLLITCGFLPGDGSIEEPYFYITAYPEIDDTSAITLEGGAYWHTVDWQGIIYKYGDLKGYDSPREELLRHLGSVFDQILEKY